ncbi:MAG: hypothetical protein ACMG6E_05450 [Candidatus Roizmanbacteria bacterium]
MNTYAYHYSEEEGEVGHQEGEVSDPFLQSPVGLLAAVVLDHEEPEEIIDQGEEDAQDEQSECPLLDLVSVLHHIDGGGAHSEVNEVRPEEKHSAGQDSVYAQHYLGQSKPSNM